jgi:4-hydroxy-2-oxoglutarate aldolase
MTALLEGIFPPLATPFDDAGELALDRLRENVLRLNGAGLSGYVALGTNGEAIHLTDDEAAHVFRAVKAAAAPGMLVIAGTGRASTRSTIELTRRAADEGCDAALVLNPFFYRGGMSDDALARHYEAVADASPIPVLLYTMPAATGVDVSAAVAARLCAHPNVKGMKDSGGDVAKLAEVIRVTASKDFALASGNYAAFLPATTFGVRAAIVAVANVAPRECVRLLSLAREGRHDEASALHLALLPVARAVTTRFGVPGLKAALELVGLYGGPPRAPLLPLGEDARREVAKTLAEAGVGPLPSD